MTMIDRVLVMRPDASGCLVRPGSYVIFRCSDCLNDYLRLFAPVQSKLFACDGAALVVSAKVSTSAMDVSAKASFQSELSLASILNPGKQDT